MNKNYIITALAIIILAVAGGIFISQNQKQNPLQQTQQTQNETKSETKEFEMTSFYEVVDGKPKPQYSMNEIIVKKGDNVKIKITVTKGSHDFNIDEYNVRSETPLNQPIIIEFKADKAGEFVYYCSRPGHREAGHWGTLKVID